MKYIICIILCVVIAKCSVASDTLGYVNAQESSIGRKTLNNQNPVDEKYAKYQRSIISGIMREIKERDYTEEKLEYFPIHRLNGAKVVEHIGYIASAYKKIIDNQLLATWISDLQWYLSTIKRYDMFMYLLATEVPNVANVELENVKVLLQKNAHDDTSAADVYLSYLSMICDAKGCPGYEKFRAIIEKDTFLTHVKKYCYFENEKGVKREDLLSFASDLVKHDIVFSLRYFRWQNYRIGDFYGYFRKEYEKALHENDGHLIQNDKLFFCNDNFKELVTLYEKHWREDVTYYDTFVDFYKEISCK